MLNEIIYPALIRLVRAFPPGTKGRPNSFGVLASFKDIDSENLNASMRDGRIGRYWGRSWESGGKSSDMIKYENALVFVRPEAISFSREVKNANEKVCQRLEIGIASLPECENCAYARSDSEIEIDNSFVLNKILSEIILIAPYLVSIPENLNGNGLDTYWLVPSEVDWLIGKGVVFAQFKTNSAYLSVKKTTDEFSSFDYGSSGMLVTTGKIQVCWCDSTEFEFDYTVNNFKQAAYTGCETC